MIDTDSNLHICICAGSNTECAKSITEFIPCSFLRVSPSFYRFYNILLLLLNMFQLKNRVIWPPLGASQLSVALSGAYCRQHVSLYYETLIDDMWRERKEGRTFNSPLFRLHETSLPGQCTDYRCRAGLTCVCETGDVLVRDCSKVELKVGLSSTKDSLTSKSVLSDDLAYIGYELYKKPQMFLADVITNHVIFLTKDGFVPVVRKMPYESQGSRRRLTRSGSKGNWNEAPAVSQNLAKWSLPSISPDPLETDVQNVKNLVPLNCGSAKEEIVGSVVRCLQDTLGLPDKTSSPISLLAILHDEHNNNKPELIFIVNSNLSSSKLSDMSSNSMHDIAFLQSIQFQSPASANSLPLYRSGSTTPLDVNTRMVSEVLTATLKLTQNFGCIEFSALKQ